MNKQILIFALLLFMTCLPALAEAPVEPGPGDLPREEAVRIATDQFLTACGSDSEILAEFTTEADLREAYTNQSGVVPRRWQVLFYYHENAGMYYSVHVASSTGKIISVDPEDFSLRLMECKKNVQEKKAAIEQGEIWMAEKGPWALWSYQDKAAFVSAYGRDSNGSARRDIGLPDDKDITLEQAVSIAQTTVDREFGEKAQRLNMLKLDCTFFDPSLLPNGTLGRAWLIVFREPDENGVYQPLYDVRILSPGGEVEIASDYTAVLSGTGKVRLWPQQPDPTAPPVMVEGDIYYNPRGGKFYHSDAKCPSVGEKYLPMTIIDQSRLNEAQYSFLRPCPNCTVGKGK